MRLSIALLVIVLSSAIAFAEKPAIEAELVQTRVVCDLPYVMHDWNFAESYHEFNNTICEVTESSYLVEVHHWYRMEGWYDGGNLTVNGEVLLPMGD